MNISGIFSTVLDFFRKLSLNAVFDGGLGRAMEKRELGRENENESLGAECGLESYS